jgi:hypothetical protein
MQRRTRLGIRIGAAGSAFVCAAALGVLAGQPAQAVPGDGAGQCANTAQPQVVSAVPATSYDDAFGHYADTSDAWSGADSTYSTQLPGNRELWSFSDTLVGSVNPDGSRPASTPFVNNSFVVTSRGSFSSVIGGTPGAPASLAAPSDPTAWLWSADPTVSGRYLEVPYLQFHRTGTGAFDFAWQKNVLARFDAHTLKLIDLTDLPSASGVEWGSYVLQQGGYSYVYGVEDLGSVKYLHIARVRGTDLLGDWQYFTGNGWSSAETDSARVMDGVSNEFSVSPLGTGYVLITQDTSELLSAHVVAYFSCSPAGPFTGKTAVYTTPETGAFGSYGNGNVYTYNPHAHPELSHGNQLLISYNVNSFDVDDIFADASIYRPRFIVATFSGAGIPAHGSVDPIGRP